MNSEIFSFSVLAAILGMAVVFLFLGILSFLMYAIKTLFGEKTPRQPEAAEGSAEQQSGSGRHEGEGSQEWVIAAAAAFLIAEDLDARYSAAAWQPKIGPTADNWLTTPRV